MKKFLCFVLALAIQINFIDTGLAKLPALDGDFQRIERSISSADETTEESSGDSQDVEEEKLYGFQKFKRDVDDFFARTFAPKRTKEERASRKEKRRKKRKATFAKAKEGWITFWRGVEKKLTPGFSDQEWEDKYAERAAERERNRAAMKKEFSQFTDFFSFQVSCMSNCRYDSTDREITDIDGIVEGEKIVFAIEFKNKNFGVDIEFGREIDIQTDLEVQRESKRIIVTMTLGHDLSSYDLDQQTKVLSLPFQVVNQIRGGGKKITKDYNLRLNILNENRAPNFNMVASEFILKGAGNSTRVPFQVEDPDGDTLVVLCPAAHGERQISPGVFEFLLPEGEHSCFVHDRDPDSDDIDNLLKASTVVKVIRENRAPTLTVENGKNFFVSSTSPKIQFTGMDLDEDEVFVECHYQGENFCLDGELSLDFIPSDKKFGKFEIEVITSDGVDKSSSKVFINLQSRDVIEHVITVHPQYGFTGKIEGLLESDEILETTIPGLEYSSENFIYKIPGGSVGNYKALFKTGELTKTEVVIIAKPWNLNHAMVLDEKFVSNNRQLWDETLVVQIPGVPSCQLENNLECISFYNSKMEQGPLDDQIITDVTFENGRFEVSFDWENMRESYIDEYIIHYDNGANFSMLFKVKVNIVPEHPEVDNEFFKVKVGQPHIYTFQLKSYEHLVREIVEVKLSGLDEYFWIFNSDYNAETKSISYDKGSADKIYNLNLYPKKEGQFLGSIEFVMSDGTIMKSPIEAEIEKSDQPTVHLSILNTQVKVSADSDDKVTSISREDLFTKLKSSFEIYNEFLTVSIKEYRESYEEFSGLKTFSKRDVYVSTPQEDDTEEDVEKREEAELEKVRVALNIKKMDAYKETITDAIPVVIFKEVISKSGKSRGGWGHLPHSSVWGIVMSGPKSTSDVIAHEVGHALGLQHTFEADKNPGVIVCTKQSDGTCKFLGPKRAIGYMVSPSNSKTIESPKKLTGDGIDDTAVDGYRVLHFPDLCYALTTSFNGGISPESYCGTGEGVVVAFEEAEHSDTLARYKEKHSVAEVCEIKDGALECIQGFKGGKKVKENVMSYWSGRNYLSLDQKAKILKSLGDTSFMINSAFDE
ncbi:MAG: hypothetical protein HOE90_11900 [Bacteriovoracaceae bacterium]|jgi:hypothetical protein|nr:hypothetical protein [Bacteriovoracaceae bacterium]